MAFRLFSRGFDLPTPGEKMRQAHAAWLSRMVDRPDADALRIPVRRVDEGGFSALLASPGGRERASQWWFEAFERADAVA